MFYSKLLGFHIVISERTGLRSSSGGVRIENVILRLWFKHDVEPFPPKKRYHDTHPDNLRRGMSAVDVEWQGWA